MPDCGYCGEDFSGEREKIEHELDEHAEEMTGHEKDEKKSELNKIEQKTQTTKHEKKKKLQYSALAVLILGIAAGTGFFAYQNMGSAGQSTNESVGVGTPVHWHADYQINVCGESVVLEGGPIEAHTHGETTFHMEGVRQTREQATLDYIVDQLGGQLQEDSIMGREDCGGEPAELEVKANGEVLEDHMNYVPRDGDVISITFA